MTIGEFENMVRELIDYSTSDEEVTIVLEGNIIRVETETANIYLPIDIVEGKR